MTNLSTVHDSLYEVVVSDVKGVQLPNNQVEDLQDNMDVWYDTLVELKRDVEIQLTDKRRELHQKSIEYSDSPEDFEAYKDSYNQWRVKVLRFMASIESKLRYVKRLRAQMYDDSQA